MHPPQPFLRASGAKIIVAPNREPENLTIGATGENSYIPGCMTENEISDAEEQGAEICKVFPGAAAGGRGFIKAVMAPVRWDILLVGHRGGGCDRSKHQ